jgi:hypothetical protein
VIDNRLISILNPEGKIVEEVQFESSRVVGVNCVRTYETIHPIAKEVNVRIHMFRIWLFFKSLISTAKRKKMIIGNAANAAPYSYVSDSSHRIPCLNYVQFCARRSPGFQTLSFRVM